MLKNLQCPGYVGLFNVVVLKKICASPSFLYYRMFKREDPITTHSRLNVNFISSFTTHMLSFFFFSFIGQKCGSVIGPFRPPYQPISVGKTPISRRKNRPLFVNIFHLSPGLTRVLVEHQTEGNNTLHTEKKRIWWWFKSVYLSGVGTKRGRLWRPSWAGFLAGSGRDSHIRTGQDLATMSTGRAHVSQMHIFGISLTN